MELHIYLDSKYIINDENKYLYNIKDMYLISYDNI